MTLRARLSNARAVSETSCDSRLLGYPLSSAGQCRAPQSANFAAIVEHNGSHRHLTWYSGGVTEDGAHWAAVEEASELLVDGELERGLTMLRDVITQDSTNPYAFHFLGAALYELKKFEEARAAYRAAISRAPNYIAARTGLAHTLRLIGRSEEALDEALEAIRRFPDDGDAHHAAGLALASLGERPRAIQHLERFLASKPDFEAQLETRQVIALLEKSQGATEPE